MSGPQVVRPYGTLPPSITASSWYEQVSVETFTVPGHVQVASGPALSGAAAVVTIAIRMRMAVKDRMAGREAPRERPMLV
jgi:hypothetical protein